MQKIKKGLEEKLNLISKIKNNLKIKKFELKKLSERTTVQFPTLQKIQSQQKQNLFKSSTQTRNPEQQITAWINIKKIGKDPQEINFLTPNFSARKTSTSFNDKILLTSTYGSRFAGKNGLMKLVQFKSLGHEKSKTNLSAQILRKTFLQKSSRTFSPQKQDNKLFKKNNPQMDLSFYGKINEINHVSGTRFKTLDPRFGGLTREELKQKIKNRQANSSLQESHQRNLQTLSPSPRVSQSLNLYEIQAAFNQSQRYSSIDRYNFEPYDAKVQSTKNRKRRLARSKDRYSPWNLNNQEEVLWDQLPKIK